MRATRFGSIPVAPGARRCLRRALFGLSLAVALAGSSRAATGDPVIFSAIGDAPYGTSEIPEFAQHVADHNLYSPSAFLVHLGDIFSSSELCETSRYQVIADILRTSAVPVFVVPGDNEWVGCVDPVQGWAFWEQHFLGYEENFCGAWPVAAQAARPENFSFVRDGVLFIGLNNVSGGPSSVEQAGADWVNAQFAAHGAAVRAAVLLAQKEPGGNLFDAVVARGIAFAKPVLYLHGNGHQWEYDPIFFGAPNMLRVQVDRGSGGSPPVQVTVTSAGEFLFDLDPWPTGTPQIVRPPCGAAPLLSIDDLFVTEGQGAVFTVSLSGGNGSPVSVSYATQNGTAQAGSDYAASSGTLSFSGTTVQRQIQVATIQDAAVEAGESFFVNLSNPSGATLAKPQGAAVLLDDDSPPPPPPPPAGGLVRLEAVGGGSTGSTSVATAGPIGAGSDNLYLAVVATKPNRAVASVSGLGLGWTPVRQQCGARAQTGITLFQARGSPGAGGIVTANFVVAPSSAAIAVSRYSGASSAGAIGSVVSANTLGVSGACSGGTDNTVYSFDLATGAVNSLVLVATSMRDKEHLPGAGYIEIIETFGGSGGSGAGTSLAERLVATAGPVGVNGSFSGTVDWSVVAAEIRAGSTPPGGPVTLSVSSSSGGRVTLNPPGGSYPAGTSVALLANADPGFTFTGWGGDLGGSANPATLVMNGNKSVSASFARLFTVTVQATSGGSVTLAPSGGIYAAGTAVSATAVPVSGFRFGAWGGALSGTSNPVTLVVDANKTLSASFIAQRQLAVSITGSGSVGLAPPGGVYDTGTQVMLSAVPGSGAAFLGWGGALAGLQNPATLLMDANKSVTANFTAGPPPPPPPPGVGPVRQEAVAGGSTGSTSVATAGPIGAGSDDLYLAVVATKPDVAVASVSGLGLVWTPVRQQCGARAQTGIALFQARGSPSAGAAVTATLAALPKSAAIAVARYSGASSAGAIGSVVSANTLGVSGACAGGADSAAYAFDLATGAANSLVFVATSMRRKEHLPSAGYTEILETFAGSGSSTAGTSLAERLAPAAGTVGVNGSFSGIVDWSAVAVEIRDAP